MIFRNDASSQKELRPNPFEKGSLMQRKSPNYLYKLTRFIISLLVVDYVK